MSRLGHDDQANRSQELVDSQRRAAIAPAPFRRIGSGTRSPFRIAPIQNHANAPVPCERALEMLVEMLAIVGDDDELPDRRRVPVVPPRRRRAPVKAWRATRRRALRQKERE